MVIASWGLMSSWRAGDLNDGLFFWPSLDKLVSEDMWAPREAEPFSSKGFPRALQGTRYRQKATWKSQIRGRNTEASQVPICTLVLRILPNDANGHSAVVTPSQSPPPVLPVLL